MEALRAAAAFAAYRWYLESRPNGTTPAEAQAFARANWAAFLDRADVGVGRLLRRLARPKRKPCRRAATA